MPEMNAEMQSTQANIQDDYWQRSEHIARLPLPPADREHDVFLLWHQSRERYDRHHIEIGIQLNRAGERDYVHVKACFYVPRIIMTVGLTPSVTTELGEERGQVLDAQQEGHDRHFIAGLQAWYYSDKKTLMLWEVDLSPSFGEPDPTLDFLLATLWQSFEQGLLARFTDCKAIVTPGWEPKYDTEQYRTFLRHQGFAPHFDNTFSKPITK